MEYSYDQRKYLNDILKLAKRRGVTLNLKNPVTIQDKMNWLNLYHPMKLKCVCADKIRVHDYCKEKIGEDLCIPIIDVYNSVNEIKWFELPEKFVMKCNHGSGMNIIVNDRNQMDVAGSIKKLEKWMATDYTFFHGGCEAHYHDIPRRIFIEKNMCNEMKLSPSDYKFFCFNGEPKYVMGIQSHKYCFYDLLYKPMSLELIEADYKRNPNIAPKPNHFDEMIEYSRKLSSSFKFVRCDFYEINDRVYLGELTFMPTMGLFHYKDRNDEKRIGDLLKL